MEILWTRNYCFKQFILWISSVSTRPSRIGVINSLWRMKKRNKSLPWCNPKKWKCWYLLRIWHLETRCRVAQASEYWRRGYKRHNFSRNHWSILLQQEIVAKFDQMEKTDVEKSLLYAENMRFLEYPQTKALAAIPARTTIGPITEVHIVKILDECGLEVAIPSTCRPGNITCVVISRETERFVNEIHNHNAEVRSSKELLDNLQESKEGVPFEKRKVTARHKETWAAPRIVQVLTLLFLTRLPYTQGKSFARVRKSGLLFMLIQEVEVIWQYSSPKQSRPCHVTSIKTKERLMDRDIGN